MAKKKLSKVPSKPKVTKLNGSDNTLYASWTWDWTGTTQVTVEWAYYAGKQGPIVDSTDTKTRYQKNSTYSPKSEATKVRCRIKAEGKYQNSKDTWYTGWSDSTYFYTSSLPPSEPGIPTTTLDGTTLKVELNIDPYDTNTDKVEFHIYQDGKYFTQSGKLPIKNKYVSWTTTVPSGDHVYKSRVFVYNKDGDSTIGDYSGDSAVIPDTVGNVSVKALTDDSGNISVRLDWSASSGAESYEVQYTTDKSYFDAGGNVISQTTNTNYCILTDIQLGEQWFFRVKAVGDGGDSGWSPIEDITIGTKPAAPTTWSSTSTAIVGEELILYWAHNSEDDSSQTWAELEINGVSELIENTKTGEDKDKTSFKNIDTNSYSEGAQLKWRVRTKGIMTDDSYWSDWSVMRTVDIYAKPELAMSVSYEADPDTDALMRFPITINATASPKTQSPISYCLSVIANETYTTTDPIGNEITVSKGSEIFIDFIDISTDLSNYILSAGNIDLENGVTYTIKCLVAMNSGLTAEASYDFKVGWGDYQGYEPEMEAYLDENNFSLQILPYCAKYPIHYWKVNYYRGVYTKTDEEISELEGEPIPNKFTKDGEQVYKGVDETGSEILFVILEDEEGILIEGVTMSVYRREYDGTFVKIGEGIQNTKDSSAYITDPYPSLDYGRYRIIATDDATGAISYSDVSGIEIHCPYAIIQWADAWRPFEVDDNYDDLESSRANEKGSMLMIRGNIDVSDKYNSDVSLVEYIGHKDPVSYYGTQRGITSTWNMEIPKSDRETLYALRRLAIWMGDCYVREPSGSGYWARISVSFNQKHCELTIPITLDITRVEGGM